MLSDYDPIMKAAAGMWEVLRRMGYPSEEIYIQPKINEENVDEIEVFITLRHAGRECSFRIGRAGYSQEEMQRRWKALALEWNAATDDERSTLFHDFLARTRTSLIAAAMLSNGFGVAPDQIADYDEKARGMQ